MTRQDLEVNATLNANFADAGKEHPDAMVAIISNPVNSTVPIFAEQMKKNGCYDPKKIFGVTLDIVRAQTFVAEAAGVDVTSLKIPVVGAHGRVHPAACPDDALGQGQADGRAGRGAHGGQERWHGGGHGQGRRGLGHAVDGQAPSSHRPHQGAERGEGYRRVRLRGERRGARVQWFATQVEIGPNGIDLGLSESDTFEKQKLSEAITELVPSITEGVEFVAEKKVA